LQLRTAQLLQVLIDILFVSPFRFKGTVGIDEPSTEEDNGGTHNTEYQTDKRDDATNDKTPEHQSGDDPHGEQECYYK